MTISVPLTDSFAIETRDGLKAFMVDHLELDEETEAQLDTLIRLAEYRLDRMLTTPDKETSTSLETTADLPYVTLPTHFRQLRTVKVDGDYPLTPVSLNYLQSYSEAPGKPQVYCISEGELWVSPTPDAAYELRLTYLTRLDPLSAANTSNWLLRQHADCYVYAVTLQCESFLANDERLGVYKGALDEAIGEINRAGNRYRMAGPLRVRSPVVV
jgi:hypothetical protein